MRKLLALGIVFALVLAVTVQAQPVKGTDRPVLTGPGAGHGTLDGTRAGPVFIIPIFEVPSWDLENDLSNFVMVVDAAAATGQPSGTPVTINGISWDVTLFADPAVGPYGGSWLTELYVSYAPLGGVPSLYLHPGAGQNFPGTMHFSSNGTIKLADVGIPDILLPTGMLELEFFEGFDDAADQIDGLWLDGYLDIQIVPEPVTLVLLMLGLPLLRRRR